MINRRQFAKQASLISAGTVVPGFLAQTAAQAAENDNGKILVVIQLSGGNDGLNTVIPYRHDVYRKQRPSLAVPANRVIKIDDELGFHPAMQAAAQLLESNKLAVINNVGYPNPDRSHFRSMEIWHSANNDNEIKPTFGWAGRALDQSVSGSTDAIFVGEEDLPLSLRARRAVATSMPSGKSLQLVSQVDPLGAMSESASGSDLGAFVQRNLSNAYASVRELNKVENTKPKFQYPGGSLSGRLRTIAKFIGLGTKARVFYAIQSGYDTHGEQQTSHTNLLSQFSNSVKSFMDEVREMGMSDRVIVFAFSEFGRRVSENGSAGTDHGTAGPVFLVGDGVKSGIHGGIPDLDDLDGDDLKMKVDFRQVYATLLERWLELPSELPLAGNYELLPVIAG